jgi:serine/threonine protein kinase/Flp pilus assembly protein TadD
MDEVPGLLERVRQGVANKYDVERELGRGGMATVFLARDIAHDRPVAIKVLHSEIAAAFSTERFLREIKLLASLQHPNILPLHDSGSFDGIRYYVMPFVAGESLRDRLNRERTLSLQFAIRVITEAASALDYAHRKGVVHRDVKPENILLSDDHVLIADFGIARAAAQSGQSLTSTSIVIGTAAYMSPEQAAGEKEIDGRSDIYSLACVMFECLTGSPPFTGDNAAAMIGRRFAGPAPRASTLRRDIPVAVDDAIARALSLSPDERPPAASAFAAMLSRDSMPHSAGLRGRRLILASAAGATILIVATGLIIRNMSTSAPKKIRPNELAAAAVIPVSHRGTSNAEAHNLYLQGRDGLLQLSPDRIRKAAEQFQAAIDRDSLYADAWAGLSDVHASIGVGNYVSQPPRPEFEQARFTANRALAIDSTLAEAHASLAVVQMMYDYDWNAARTSLDRAQTYDSGYDNTYLYRSFLFGWLGKFDSAAVVSRLATRLNPSATRFRQDIARTLLQRHRFAEAERELIADVAAEPANGRLRMLLAEAYIGLGKWPDAVAAIEHAQRLLPTATRVTAFRVAAYHGAGRTRDAQRLVDSLVALSDRSFVPSMDIAIAYAGAGNRDQALAWLDNSYNDRTLRPYFRDPIFDFVKSDPRYQTLLSKLHLER